MKTMLFITLADVSAYGVKCLSAYLQQQGRVADVLCLRLSDNRTSLLLREPGGKLPPGLLKNLLGFVDKYDCIGISLFSDGLNESAALSTEIKRHSPRKTIIWGGIHPTLKPVECLKYADYVCVGEGYYSLYDLLVQLDSEATPADLPGGIVAPGFIPGQPSGGQAPALRGGGCSKMCSHLDSLPYPNYDAQTVYVRGDDHVISPLNRNGYRKYLDYVYYTMFSQGCPNSCSYCCNNALKKLDNSYLKIRRHSVEYMLGEIKAAAKYYTFYNVYFMDDSFILTDRQAFDEFVERYPREIGLPFIVTGLIPRLVTQGHIDRLVEAGMVRARIGIQTGSSRMLKVYNRRQSAEEVLKVSDMVSRHRKRMVPLAHDIILDGYGETVEDTIETARLISRLKRPLVLNLASLRPYPGTEISEKMGDYRPGDSYVRVNDTVINSLIGLMSVIKIPPKLLERMVARKGLMARKVPPAVTALLYYATLIKKTFYHLYFGEYSSKPAWLVDMVRKIKTERRQLA